MICPTTKTWHYDKNDASNGTHFDIDLRPPDEKGKNIKGLGGLLQFIVNDCLKVITSTDMSLAEAINAAIKAVKAAGCECYCLHIRAHSQGAMVTKMALSLVPENEKKNITVVTVGGQVAVPEKGLKFVYNLVHVDDPVPNTLGSAPSANGGRGVNPFRWFLNCPGKVEYFGKKGTYEGFDAHAFDVYSDELTRNPPKLERCPQAKKKGK